MFKNYCLILSGNSQPPSWSLKCETFMVTIQGSFLAIICTIHQYFAVLAAKKGSDMACAKVHCFKMSLILPHPIIGIGARKNFSPWQGRKFLPHFSKPRYNPTSICILVTFTLQEIMGTCEVLETFVSLNITYYTTGSYWEAAYIFIQDKFFVFDSPVESRIKAPLSKDEIRRAITVFLLKKMWI